MRPRRHAVPLPAAALGLAAVYAALYWFVDASSALDSPIGAAYWPASGVTVVVLLWRERREWPVLFLIIAATEAALDVWAGFDPAVSVAMGLANATEPLVAATLLLRGGRAVPDLTQRAGLTRFLLCAVLAGPAVGAVIGSVLPALIAGDPLLPRLPRWFVGDAVGVLVVAPAVQLLMHNRLQQAMIVPLAVLAGVAVVLVGPWTAPSEAGLPFLVLPALAFTAVRLGPVGAALGVLLVSVIVELAAVAGTGPFAHEGPFGGLIVVQMFLAMSSLTSLTVGMLAHDLVTREELEASLREQALHDELTGLANRRLMFDRLERANLRLERGGTTLALLYVDLDAFKAVNDRWGHAAGDAVLREIADRLAAVVRPHDTVARLGGDEFVVLVEDLGTDSRAAVDATVDALAARVAAACERAIIWEGTDLRVGASIGIAIAERPADTAEQLLTTADRAMYRAKRTGGHRSALDHITDGN